MFYVRAKQERSCADHIQQKEKTQVVVHLFNRFDDSKRTWEILGLGKWWENDLQKLACHAVPMTMSMKNGGSWSSYLKIGQGPKAAWQIMELWFLSSSRAINNSIWANIANKCWLPIRMVSSSMETANNSLLPYHLPVGLAAWIWVRSPVHPCVWLSVNHHNYTPVNYNKAMGYGKKAHS